MQFGINTFLFASPFTDEATHHFPAFAQWGFDFVEIALEDPINIDPIGIRHALEQHNLTCRTVCAAMGPERDLRGTPEQQKTALIYLKAVMDMMPKLGATILCGPLYSSVGRADQVSEADHAWQFKTVVRHLTNLGDYAQQRGITLAIEPLNRFETDFVNTTAQGMALVKAINHPAVGLHLDTFHMNIEEKSSPQAIWLAGSYLKHVHASGTDRGTPGNDHADWLGVAEALRGINYEGDLVIESFSPDVKAIAKAAAIWRPIEPSRESIARNGVQFLKRTF